MIKTYTHFLNRDDLYNEEKPYSLRFAPPSGFPRSNIKLERHDVLIKDIRQEKGELSFSKDGFDVVNIPSAMSYDDFGDEKKVKALYLKEVAEALKQYLKADHVQVFEHTVRKRHEIFPISTGEAYEYNQPTSIAHVGMCPDLSSC
jgi:hypothetical protein